MTEVVLGAIEADSTVVEWLNEGATRPPLPPLADLSPRRSAAYLFLGTLITVAIEVTKAKRRDVFVEFPRAGRYPSFIFVTAIRRRL